MKMLPLVLGGALATVFAAVAFASAPPVGPLPRGPVVSVTTARGTPIAVALPQSASSSGLVWRVARPFDARVVHQVGEGRTSGHVILIFRGVARGRTTISLALTKGETRKAYKSVIYRVTVR